LENILNTKVTKVTKEEITKGIKFFAFGFDRFSDTGAENFLPERA